MSTSVSIDSGRIVVEVPDAQGEVWPYDALSCDPGRDAFALRLVRQDSQEERRVSRDQEGRWRCSCPDFYFRLKYRRRETCKHIRAAQDVLALVGLLAREGVHS